MACLISSASQKPLYPPPEKKRGEGTGVSRGKDGGTAVGTRPRETHSGSRTGLARRATPVVNFCLSSSLNLAAVLPAHAHGEPRLRGGNLRKRSARRVSGWCMELPTKGRCARAEIVNILFRSFRRTVARGFGTPRTFLAGNGGGRGNRRGFRAWTNARRTGSGVRAFARVVVRFPGTRLDILPFADVTRFRANWKSERASVASRHRGSEVEARGETLGGAEPGDTGCSSSHTRTSTSAT